MTSRRRLFVLKRNTVTRLMRTLELNDIICKGCSSTLSIGDSYGYTGIKKNKTIYCKPCFESIWYDSTISVTDEEIETGIIED